MEETTLDTTTTGYGPSGFLLLEDCEISVRRGSTRPTSSLKAAAAKDSDDSPTLFSNSSGRWIPLHHLPSQRKVEEEEEAHANKSSEEGCSHCRLTLLQWQQEIDDDAEPQCSVVVAEPTPRFDGTTLGLKPDERICSCNEKPRQRSDGALLLGLALTCQDMGHINIRSVEILQPPTNGNTKRAGDYLSSGVVSPSASGHQHRVALLITLSVPEIQQQTSSPSGKSRRRTTTPRSAAPPQRRKRFISNSSKPLPPATQLLLSILRSDWDFLDKIRKQPELMSSRAKRDPSSHSQSLGFFPSKVSLDEVYQRIGGATTSFLDREDEAIPPLRCTKSSSSTVSCLELPKDVWQYHIGAFLKAKSLYALRCTSKHFHRILQEVVPGLRLRLYTHQVKSLSWMRLRETKPVAENELSYFSKNGEAVSMMDDIHNAATGGATVLLRSRPSSNNADAAWRQQRPSVHRISQYNGEEVILRSDDPLSRSIARGGLLCDDPGLGKTITVLSLILQTLGLSTEANRSHDDDGKAVLGRQDQESDTYEERIFLEYWREQSIPQFRSQALNKLLSDFIRSNPATDIFVFPVDPEKEDLPDYFDVISNPICLQDVRKRINGFQYDDSFSSFQSDVILCFRNAMTYHAKGDPVHLAAEQLKHSFLEAVREFKQKQVQIAKKSFSRASAKPNSSVAALVELNSQIKLQNALVQSSSTLLVVPSVLLEHWQDQLRLHVNLTYCTSKIPIIFEFTGTADNNLRLEEVVRECQVDKSHCPFLFVDKTGTRKLPSHQFLAMFAIVLTTNQRFTNEWKNGSFEEELRHAESESNQTQTEYDFRSSLSESEEACALLKVNWLRMIVDEGHSMGRGKENSAISFASWISAERRWAMTGTPTRQVVSQSGLTNLLNLVNYLQHDFFSRRQDGQSVWQNMIARGWSKGMLFSFFRVRKLLALLMVRHTKLDIEELPLPSYQSKILPMSMEETKTYNTLVCAVQSNLVITSMKGKTSGQQDSLLHRSQGRHARNALRNVRLVCAGGTQVIPTITEKFWTEFLEDFEFYNPDPELKQKMTQYLSRATTERVSPCGCCSTLLTTLLVIPCGDLVCTECFDPKSNHCIVCDKEFDIDIFQKLQPGMDYQWLHNIEEEKKNTNIKATAKVHHEDSEETVSRAELLDDGRGVLVPHDSTRQRQRTAKPGDGHKCVYSPRDPSGECELCWREHDNCNLLTASGRCEVCYRVRSSCPEFETKPCYVVEKLLALHEEQRKRTSIRVMRASEEYILTSNRRPLKVIMFSQFRSVLNTVGDRLIRRCGTSCIAEYWGKYRKQELHKFIHDNQCFCMLLGKDGSEGLDLSFVTNIIFLEQVWDKSLEQQVVARAWRMGAKGSVQVETLVAENSVEELMARLEVDIQRGTHQHLTELQGMQSATDAGKGSDYQRAKLQFLLKNLRLITSSATNPLMAGPGERKRNLQEFKTQQVGDQKAKRRRVQFAA